MGERVADAGLGGQVDDGVEPLRRRTTAPWPGRSPGRGDESGSADCGHELRQPVLLQLHAVVVVEVVQPDHLVAGGQEPAGEMEADEARGAGDEDIAHVLTG